MGQMKLSEARDAYQDLSGKASEQARMLAFAGIAIIWVFKTETPNGPNVPLDLVMPGFLFVGALAADLLQYATGAFFWGGFARYQELRGRDHAIKAPRWINWSMVACFAAKLLLVAAAYAVLLRYLAGLAGGTGP